MYSVLVVEDDKGLNRGITFALERVGYRMFSAKSKEEMNQILNREGGQMDAILLDLNLPDGDGVDLCREIRRTSDLPVIMITARDLETDEVMGLSNGADDYITKPFSLSVLSLRLEKLLARRDSSGKEEACLRSGAIVLHPGRMKAYKEEKELDLSQTEYRLLLFFLEHKNQVLLKEQILGRLWDADGNFVDENTLPVNIRRLRQKIEADPSRPDYIKTVYGMGYLWEEK